MSLQNGEDEYSPIYDNNMIPVSRNYANRHFQLAGVCYHLKVNEVQLNAGIVLQEGIETL